MLRCGGLGRVIGFAPKFVIAARDGGSRGRVAGVPSGLLIVFAAAVSCGGADRVETTRDVEYADGHQLDIHAPRDGDDLPVVVLVHGAGLDRDDYGSFADRIAEAGAVVFNVDWDVLPTSSDAGLQQVACAVRFARDQAADHGGDPERVVLVGHSSAAAYAGRVAVTGDEFTGPCSADASALANALAMLASASPPGGRPWHHSLFGENPDLKVAVIHGATDGVAATSVSERTAEVLRDAGYDVTLEIVPGGHYDLVMVNSAGSDGSALAADGDPEPADRTIAVILGLVDNA